jgi:hypothetical protein
LKLTVKDIENYLSTDYAYTVSKFTKKPQTNPIFKHFKRYQFQVCIYKFNGYWILFNLISYFYLAW